MSKVKKPFYKRVWFWILAAVIVFAAIGSAAPEVDQTTTEPAAVVKETDKPAAAAKPTAKPEPKNDPGISKAEFDQIKNGMTYKEVSDIIGGKGEVMSEVGQEGEPGYTIMFMYDGESGFGSNANFMFQDGELISKAQFGLE